MRTWIAVSLLVLGSLAPAAGRAADAPDKPVETLSNVMVRARLAIVKAAEARAAGDADTAIDLLRTVLHDYPKQDHFLVRTHLGSSLLMAGRLSEAADQFEKAVEMEPRHAQSWLSLGQVAYEIGEYARAGRALRKGFETSADPDPELLYYAGAAYLLAGDAGTAAGILEDLTSGRHGRPRLEWFRALVSACVDLKDAARGERAVDAMLKVHPEDPESWQLAFQQAAAASDYRRATVALTVKSYFAPLTDAEKVQLGDLYRVVGVPLKASELYGEALGDDAGTEDFERLAAAYMAAHEPGEARRVLEEAIAAEPTLRLWSLLGDLGYMEERYEDAYAAFAKCTELDPEHGRAWLMMGYCALELERLDEATELLTKAKAFPDQEETAVALLRQADAMRAGQAE